MLQSLTVNVGCEEMKLHCYYSLTPRETKKFCLAFVTDYFGIYDLHPQTSF